jgi:hypothetical protein
MVGLIPLFAVETLEPEMLERLPASSGASSGSSSTGRSDRQRRVHERPGEASAGCCRSSHAERLQRVLRYMLDEREFLSPYGIRASVARPRDQPYVLPSTATSIAWTTSRASRRRALRRNSNWRGPIWFPVNYLLIESLQKFHHYFADDVKECPTGSGQMIHAPKWRQSCRIAIGVFCASRPARAVFGDQERFPARPEMARPGPFFEYFTRHGRGVGASIKPVDRWWLSCSSKAAIDMRAS